MGCSAVVRAPELSHRSRLSTSSGAQGVLGLPSLPSSLIRLFWVSPGYPPALVIVCCLSAPRVHPSPPVNRSFPHPRGDPSTEGRTRQAWGAGSNDSQPSLSASAVHCSSMTSLDMNSTMWVFLSPFLLEETEAPRSRSCGRSGHRADRRSSCRRLLTGALQDRGDWERQGEEGGRTWWTSLRLGWGLGGLLSHRGL